MPLTISVFPNDNLIWRIDWLGSVSYPDRMTMHGQPSLLVRLSEVDEGGRAKLPRKFQNCYVSIGTLVLLRIGDLWQSREFLASPPYTPEEWNIEIGSTTSIIKAGLSIEDDFVLPLAEHPGHQHDTRSYCVMIKLPDGRTVVVPALELIRFYFGSSSTLLEHLFRPPLDRGSLYSNAVVEEGVAELDLAKGIRRASAHDVARIAFSDVAWNAARAIGQSCFEQASKGEPLIYPKARFPFYGPSKLKAKGQWLSRGPSARRTFLVHELLSCSHRFPYDELHYTVHKDTETGRLNRSSSTAGNSATVQSGKPAIKALEQEDASSKHAGRQAFLRRRSQFTDLDFKKAVGKVSLTTQEGSEGAKVVSRAATPGAVGTQATSGKIGAVALLTGAKSQPPRFLKPLLAALASLPWKADLLTGAGEDGWSVQWPQDSNEESAIADASGTPMSAFALVLDGRRFILVALGRGDQIALVLAPGASDQLHAHLDAALKSAIDARDVEDRCAQKVEPPDLAGWLSRELARPDVTQSSTASF